MSLCGTRQPVFEDGFRNGVVTWRLSVSFCMVLESNERVVANCKPKIKGFSLKNNLALLLSRNVEYVDLGFEFRPGLFLNEALHWLVKSRVKEVLVVLAFDLVERGLLEIPLSQDLAMELTYDKKIYYLRVLKGCLGLCCSSFGGMAEMWIMKEYKVQSSWTRIVLSACDISRNSFFPICFTKCGDVFGSNEFGRLLRLNDEGKLLEHRALWRGKSRYRVLHSRVYTESLLPFPDQENEDYPPF
ncbi:uncharacterized protein LOC130716770 [Lotus japonicus]|uniref:uncharacterized protein LOC130716770 n=1 Tax=Lotus japonicus TaxID=34305 RepID=UPI0025840B77|nr:uncharacterized protein LOC130716770 [Lotus japonicus]